MRAGLRYCVTIMLSRSFLLKICSCGGMSLPIRCFCQGYIVIFLQIINNFSLRQRFYFLLILLYGLHFLNSLHLTLKGLFVSEG